MKVWNLWFGIPSCTLMTGKHTGHAYIRANDEMNERGDVWHDPNIEGQRPPLPDTETLVRIMQRAGYVTGAIGKWGLGGPNDSGHPNKQGFDFWYGYLCQRVAHNYYPTHLWRNDEKEMLEGNDYFYPHQKLPDDVDGISLLPTFLGKKQTKHEYLYWEYVGKQAIRMGNWKAVKPGIHKKIELYDLKNDRGEKNNVADQNPEIVAEIVELMKTARTKSELFPLVKRD